MNFNNDLKIDVSWYLCDIPLTTHELERYFGCKPRESSQEHTRYEWVFEYNNKVYCIYDWSYMDDTFDEYYQTEWYLGGKDESDINTILELIEMRSPVTEKTIQVESVIEW
jgi:hypothetical protein